MGERSAAEREAARLERERRRAKREGRPLPEPPPPTPPAAEHEQVYDAHAEQVAPAPEREPESLTGERPIDPQETQQFDVALAWTGEHAAAQPTEQYDVTAGWTGEHPVAADAPPVVEPPPVSELAPGAVPDSTPDTVPDSAPGAVPDHSSTADPAPGAVPEPARPPAAEAPLGTRRVAAGQRRPARGGGRTPPPPPARRRVAPRPSGGRPRWGLRVGALAALVLVVVAAWFLYSLYQPGAGDGEGRVIVQVPRGATVSEIGDLLSDRGVIDSSFFFGLRAKLSGSSGDLKSGTFTLRQDMSYVAALDALSSSPPPPPVIRLTIPEGKSRGEIAPLAKQAGVRGNYRAASRNSRELNPRAYGAPKGATLEGFLFPATYELKRGATARQLVKQQLLAFRQNLASVNLRYARSKNLTVYDVLTIASMVEREVAVARERPLVAAVIYNRLSDGMPLGIDATLRFELNDWVNPLKVSQLEADTPYNTRTNSGLPPGPIGNPGLASIRAAAHPANVDYLFYVVKPGTCGQHAFSSTDAQFEQDVARYNAARDAAGGKSPTKC